MNILHVASEVSPWSQSGGLAEVAAALPRAQRAMGEQVRVVVPLYRSSRRLAERRGSTIAPVCERFTVSLGHHQLEVGLVAIDDAGAEGVWFVDCPALYDRDGLYAGADHHDYADNALRFGALARVGTHVASSLLGHVDVLHGHDWQAGLAPVFANALANAPATVFTIHNLAYQGVFAKQVMNELGLDWSLFTLDGLELYDQVSLLKAGVAFSGAVTTVSPTYAEEITTPAFGCGLEGFLQHNARHLTGIVNGIDTGDWDPARDSALPARYGLHEPANKATCRAALAAELDIALGDGDLLCGIVSRFAWQKGLDLVAELAPELAAMNVWLIVLGTGEPALEAKFRALAANPASRVRAVIAFDPVMARRIYAGCDAMLMPSRFEPCGLNQLYAMRYGTIPIVSAVGGLRDTVVDPGDDELAAGHGTGFRFEHADLQGLRWAVDRAARFFRERPRGWRTLMRTAMSRDSSWTASAAEYRALYNLVIAERRSAQ